MTTNINIKEAIEDKNTWFNVKRFKIGNIKSDGPLKSINLGKTNQELVKNLTDFNNIILENSKIVGDYSEINNIIKEHDNSKIKSFFGHTTWSNDYFSLVSMTFKFNPLKGRNIKLIEPFFNYYYTYSKDALFVPNLKIDTYDEQKGKSIITMNLTEYIQFVDEVYNLLNQKNNKPIFVPISLKLSAGDLITLINHYLKKEYYNFWIDFEGRAVNEAISGRLRTINQLIKDKGQFSNVVIYFTNIKREIISNNKDSQSPASDILASIQGANFVGVNREPVRPPISNPRPPQDLREHKARTFDPVTYYYIKNAKFSKLNPKLNITDNTYRLHKELEVQSKKFLTEFKIKDYLQEKEMLKNYQNGNFIRNLIRETKKDKSLDDFF